ncbi:hypothetical protein HPB47_022990, partial [Ixodes persulcatus]
KGEKLRQHVFSVEEIIDGSTNKVKAKCVSQVRQNVVYDITLQLSTSPRAISTASCTCRAGVEGRCKHCAA